MRKMKICSKSRNDSGKKLKMDLKRANPTFPSDVNTYGLSLIDKLLLLVDMSKRCSDSNIYENII